MHRLRGNVALISIVSMMLIGSVAAQTTAPALWTHAALRALPFDQAGPFIDLADGGVLCIRVDAALVSHDDGVTWQTHPLFPAGKFKVRPEYALVRTKKGAIVLLFIDDLDKQWKWNSQTNSTEGDPRLFVWCTRSTDGGRTWTPPVRVQDGYCGAIRDVIETRDGNLVTPLQRYLPEHARHATTPFVSTDDGVTWQPAGLLDLGGRGHHDGSIEPTLCELRDGRLWMLLRTNNDVLYQSFSTDGGKSWGELSPTKIDASGSPAMIKRLASGRLMLAWNRLDPEGKTDSPRRAGQASQRPASWHREELSIAFSEDDGATWSRPLVVARAPGARVAYPFILERRPGVIWLSTMQGGLRAELGERDFVAASPRSSIEFHKINGGAVLDNGSAGAFDANWSASPCVARVGDRYRMWYSGYFTSREGAGGIGVATSPDGIHWTRESAGHPVVTAGPAGSFDSQIVCAPEVLYDGSKYRMWYTGQSDREHPSRIVTYQIGMASSTDGVRWTRENNGQPVIAVGPAGSPDEVQAATPSVLKTADGYRMWYAAWSPKFNHTICMARSSDGVNWTKENGATPVEGLSPSIAYGQAVTKIGSRYFMLYMALKATRNLYAASSDDGVHWTMQNGGEPVIVTGGAGEFDSDIIGHPYLLHEDGKLRAWYTGYQKSGSKLADWKLRIGLAEAALSEN